jgi:aldehyde dehydrogenase (NAD+)
MAEYSFGLGRFPHGEMVASEISDKDSYMIRKPKGVIAIISPFNFPSAIGAFWCAAPAIVEGNTVVLKPSEDAPMSSQLAVEIYKQAGLPEGVINLVHGEGETGDHLVRADVDHVCFTGSVVVGQHIRKVAAESLHKTTSCEMGSKSAVLVFEDANLELALDACIASAFKLSGQRCVSASRLIVHRSHIDTFARRFAEKAGQLKVGNPFKPISFSTGAPENVCWDSYVPNKDIYYGPLINQQGMSKVVGYNQMIFLDPEAKVLLHGQREGMSGFFMSPTVFVREWADVPYLKEEIFGPTVAIIPFDTVEEAIDIYNDTQYGLAVGIITEDFKTARKCRDECDAGMIYWNGGSIAAESHVFFGGVKASGNGFPSAAGTVHAVTHKITYTVNHAEKLEFPQGMK